jgi:hypothetical protein
MVVMQQQPGRGASLLCEGELSFRRWDQLTAYLGDPIPVALLAPARGVLARHGGVGLLTVNGQFCSHAALPTLISNLACAGAVCWQ